MKGFAERCLVLFPSPDFLEEKPDLHVARFRRSVDKLLSYLSYIGIEPCAFVSDEVSLRWANNFTMLQTLPRPDMFFMQRHNDSMSVLKNIKYEFQEELCSEASKKFPVTSNSSVEERFSVACKRESFITKKLINDYKLVFYFTKGYNVKSALNDGKLRVSIDSTSLVCTCRLSGQVMDVCSMFAFQGAQRPLYQWEEDLWTRMCQ